MGTITEVHPLQQVTRTSLTSVPVFQPKAQDIPGGHFPTKKIRGANRSFHPLPSGEQVQREWLSYSIVKDVMYCFPCFLFAGDTSKSGKGRFSKEWAEDGLSDWKDGLQKIYKHEKSESHMLCCEKLTYFRSGKGIDLLIDEQRAQIATQREATIKHNRAILERMV